MKLKIVALNISQDTLYVYMVSMSVCEKATIRSCINNYMQIRKKGSHSQNRSVSALITQRPVDQWQSNYMMVITSCPTFQLHQCDQMLVTFDITNLWHLLLVNTDMYKYISMCVYIYELVQMCISTHFNMCV